MSLKRTLVRSKNTLLLSKQVKNARKKHYARDTLIHATSINVIDAISRKLDENVMKLLLTIDIFLYFLAR